MPWDLVITKPAERDLREPSRDDLRRINRALEAMRADPYSGDVKFLQGEGALAPKGWRVADLFQGGARQTCCRDPGCEKAYIDDILTTRGQTRPENCP